MQAQRKTLALALMAFGLVTGWAAAASSGPILLVIPARYTMVQFSFDVASLRESYIVSFDKGKEGGLLMHVWDKTANDWVKTDLETYAAGTLFATPPAEAFIVGADADVPATLVSATSFCPVQRVPNLGLVTFANKLNESIKFKSSEWRWLAARHKLQIVDLNEDRRRYGRYGKAGEKAGDAMPSGAKEVEESMVDVPVAPAPKTSAVPAPVAPAPVAPAPTPAAAPADMPAMDK